MRKVFLLLDGKNPIVIKTLQLPFSTNTLENHFEWQIPLPEYETELRCFYPSEPTKYMLEQLTKTAIKYVRGEV